MNVDVLCKTPFEQYTSKSASRCIHRSIPDNCRFLKSFNYTHSKVPKKFGTTKIYYCQSLAPEQLVLKQRNEQEYDSHSWKVSLCA